jgi:hypothetical protein
MHRYTWDLHYQPLDQVGEGSGESGGVATATRSVAAGRLGGPNLPIAAVGHNTVATPTTPWVNPGRYTARLTVNGQTYSQSIIVKQDPRVKTPALEMQQVYSLSKAMYYAALAVRNAGRQAQTVRDRLASVKARATGDVVQTIATVDAHIVAIAGPRLESGGGGGRGAAASPGPPDSLSGASAGLDRVMNLLQGADVKPTAVQLGAIARARGAASRATARWTAFKTADLGALNATLKTAGLPAVSP